MQKQIICLSTSPWYPYPTRKQQVMSRLSDARILYFNPPVTHIARFKDPEAAKLAKEYRNDGQRVTDNITVYSLPPVLPFFNLFRFINRLNQKKLARFIRKICRVEGVDSAALWVYSPTSADILDCLAYRCVIYDCVDRHSGYKGFVKPSVVDKMEKELAGSSDAVFATATGLYDTLKSYNPNTHLIPNGANFELFAKAREEQEAPEKMAGISHPIFGFVGTLQSCIDLDLIEQTAGKHPEWSFVLIGPELPGVVPDTLRNCENVHLLGLVPYEELPAYLAQFDVCLNLFRRGKLSKDVSPLKFYEYLATGKPIVSTLYPDQVQEFEGPVYISRSAPGFEEKCSEALAESDPSLAEQRIKWGQESSWDSRVRRMEELLAENGIFPFIN